MAIDSTTCAALLQFDGNLTDATAKTTWVNNNGATFDSGAARFGSCLFLNNSYLTSGYTTGLDLLAAGAFGIGTYPSLNYKGSGCQQIKPL